RKGLDRNEDIAQKANTRVSSVRRFLKGIPARSDTFQGIFMYLLGYGDASFNALSSEQREQLDAKSSMYCVEVAEDALPDAEGGGGNAIELLSQTAIEPDHVISCMLVYIKFLFLRDMRTATPVYRKFVPRINCDTPVFDEFIMFRTVCFKEKTAGHKVRGRS